MFLRKLKNRAGNISEQIILKANGKYKVVKTIRCGSTEEIERLSAQSKIFVSEKDTIVEQVIKSLDNASIRTVGPELVFGKLYDNIGFIWWRRNCSGIWS